LNWEDLKRKLSSRKFWAALAGFVTAVLYAMNWAESDITQMAGIITAAGVRSFTVMVTELIQKSLIIKMFCLTRCLIFSKFYLI